MNDNMEEFSDKWLREVTNIMADVQPPLLRDLTDDELVDIVITAQREWLIAQGRAYLLGTVVNLRAKQYHDQLMKDAGIEPPENPFTKLFGLE